MISQLPFRLNSDSQRIAFNSELVGILSKWLKTWCSSPPELQVRLLNSDATPNLNDGNWIILGKAPDLWLAWKQDNGVTREFLGVMFNAPIGASGKTTPLMSGIMKECLTNLSNEVFAACKLSDKPTHDYEGSLETLRTGYGSGAIFVELKIGSLNQHIAFGGEVVERIAPVKGSAESTSLFAREEALGNYKTTLEIAVGGVELTLKDIEGIEVGDVIRLNKRIQEPFAIRTIGGLSLANGHLGVIGKHKAVKLVD